MIRMFRGGEISARADRAVQMPRLVESPSTWTITIDVLIASSSGSRKVHRRLLSASEICDAIKRSRPGIVAKILRVEDVNSQESSMIRFLVVDGFDAVSGASL